MSRTTVGPIEKHIGGRIRMRRLQLGLSQAELGEKLDVSFQQIQKYEKGVNSVGAVKLQTLAAVLGVDINFFYLGAPTADAAPRAEADSLMDEFMSSKDGLIIAEAFVRIADPAVRHTIAQSIGNLSRALAPPQKTLMAAE